MDAKKWASYFFLPSTVLIFGIFLTFSQSHAVDYYWIGRSGSWSDPANWNPPGPPQEWAKVYLIQSDSTNRTVNLSIPVSISKVGFLRVDATGSGTMTLSISQEGRLIPAVTMIGYNGTGIVNQTGGNYGWINGGVYLRCKPRQHRDI